MSDREEPAKLIGARDLYFQRTFAGIDARGGGPALLVPRTAQDNDAPQDQLGMADVKDIVDAIVYLTKPAKLLDQAIGAGVRPAGQDQGCSQAQCVNKGG
jgi:hypothetical protein